MPKRERVSSQEFQSLLHQGISLLKLKGRAREYGLLSVSIPSSSGHQFTVKARNSPTSGLGVGFNPFFIRASVYCCAFCGFTARNCCRSFQSLLHQGISLLNNTPADLLEEEVLFQSLLHQGISLLLSRCRLQGPTAGVCFNPFFIRASVYCVALFVLADAIEAGFNPFFIRASVYCHAGRNRQTAGGCCFNPFFIRASVYWPAAPGRAGLCADAFQSLLHQGISLLHAVAQRGVGAPGHPVSIPSSSGHQFTGKAYLEFVYDQKVGFNPFFIRASVYWICPPGMRSGPARCRFNPFFIRASVYCHCQSPEWFPFR